MSSESYNDKKASQEIKDKFAKELAKIMEAKNLNQTDVGTICGIHRCSISKILNSKVNITLATMSKIMRSLGENMELKLISKDDKKEMPSDEYIQEYIKFIKKELGGQGMSICSLAKKCGLSQPQVSTILNGKAKMSLRSYELISKVIPMTEESTKENVATQKESNNFISVFAIGNIIHTKKYDEITVNDFAKLMMFKNVDWGKLISLHGEVIHEYRRRDALMSAERTFLKYGINISEFLTPASIEKYGGDKNLTDYQILKCVLRFISTPDFMIDVLNYPEIYQLCKKINESN